MAALHGALGELKYEEGWELCGKVLGDSELRGIC